MVAKGLDSVEGLAIDWIAGNMYWTNPKYHVIEVARINGSFQVTLYVLVPYLFFLSFFLSLLLSFVSANIQHTNITSLT